MSDDFSELPLYDNPPQHERVRGLICADDQGQIQVIAPEQALVDPRPIEAATARTLHSMQAEQSATVSAIPGYYGLRSVVHSDLKYRDSLALATETPGRYVRTTGSQLKQLCLVNGSFAAEFCEQLQGTPLCPVNDEADIVRAVESFTARRIEARLDETLHIPPLPDTARRIIELQGQEDYELSDLVKIIEADPPIAARIMGWANSSFYGTETPSTSLNDAIMRVLGFDMVFNMALGMAISNALTLPKRHVSGASPYWLNAVYNATTMEALAKKIAANDGPNPGTCYLAGLLANFGTLVLGQVFPPQYEIICRLTEANPQLPYSYIDQHVLNVSREVLAATLFELWDLPDEICCAVRFQQVSNYTGTHQSYVRLQMLTRELLTLGQHGLNETHYERAEALGLKKTDLIAVSELVRDSRTKLDELAGALSR